jgi:hypothetical protein
VAATAASLLLLLLLLLIQLHSCIWLLRRQLISAL